MLSSCCVSACVLLFTMGANNTTLHRESVSKHWAVSKKILGKGSFATVRKATKKKTSNAERKAIQESFPEIVAVKVVEKSKAIAGAQQLIGHSSVKIASDFTKHKKSGQKGFQFKSAMEEETLVHEYGSFIFSIPDANRNQERVLKEFGQLVSKNFRIE